MLNLKMCLLTAVAATVSIGASYSASAQSSQPGSAPKCEVVIDRSLQAGAFDLTKQVSPSGDCTCYLYTGPASQSGAVENNVSALLRSKTCANSRVMNMPDRAAAGVGGKSTALNVLLGLTAAGIGGFGVVQAIEGVSQNRVSP